MFYLTWMSEHHDAYLQSQYKNITALQLRGISATATKITNNPIFTSPECSDSQQKEITIL